jgi:hypothetical protein
VAEPEGDVEHVDLVGRGEDAARFGRRKRASGGIGQVLLGNRGADRLRIAGEPCVLGSDVALELRKLADELGGLIGLGESGGLERRLSAT